MGFAWTRGVLCKDLLTTERAITTSSAIWIATHIAVYMADVVSVFLVERLVIDLAEAAPPEDQTLLEVESNALEEQGVLQSAEMLEMGIFSKGSVEMGHASWEMLWEVVDVACGDLGAVWCWSAGHVRGVGGNEVLGKVVEDGSESVVLV
jgi:hypothetical protein